MSVSLVEDKGWPDRMNDARVAFRLTRREVIAAVLAAGALLLAAGLQTVPGAQADVPGVQVHFSCPPNDNNQYDVFIFNDTPHTGHPETISGDIQEFEPNGNLVSDIPTGNIDPAKAGEFPYGPSASHPTPPEGHRFVVNITGKGVAFDQVFSCVTSSTTTTTPSSSTTTQPSSTTTSSTASNSSGGTTTTLQAVVLPANPQLVEQPASVAHASLAKPNFTG